MTSLVCLFYFSPWFIFICQTTSRTDPHCPGPRQHSVCASQYSFTHRRFHCSEFISVLQTIYWNIRNLLSLNGFSYLSFHIGFVLKIRQTVEWYKQTSSTAQLCNIGPIVGMTDMRSILPGSFQVQPVIFSRQWIKVLSKREWWEISNKTVEVVRLEWSSSL